MRPKEIYKLILNQRELDGNSFSKKYHSQFVDIACPACGCKGESAFKKFGFQHSKCPECNTMFCTPRPNNELLSIYYNSYDSPKLWTDLLIKTGTERKALQYQSRIEKIVSSIKSDGKNNGGVALDVGAGSGAFCVCLGKTNFFKEIIALDFSKDCVQSCQDKGLTSKYGTIEDMDDNSVDIICINDLIEHLFDPFVFLNNCLRVIRKGGYLYISTPNGEGFDFKILKERTKNITPPEHLNYFNTNSMHKILTDVGFKVKFIETPGILDAEIVLKEMESGFKIDTNNEYLDYLFKQDQEVLSNFQKFLSDNKLSSHMSIMAQKTI